MIRENSLGTRLIALVLSVVMVLGMVPTGVVVAVETDSYGAVESLTDGVTITGSETSETKATFGNAQLQWVASDTEIDRNSDGWWVGIQVNAPAGVNLELAKYQIGGTTKSFWENKDSADDAQSHHIQLWGLVTEEYLAQANATDGLSTYTWTFDWDGDTVYDQTVTLDVEAATTVLLDQSGKQVYPIGGAVESLTNGVTVTGSETPVTKATFAGAQLQWVAKDEDAGRNSDGWWVGIQVNAPTGVDVSTLQNAKYMIGGTEKSFWTMKDSADDAQSHHIQLWGLVTEEYLAQANATDGLSTYTWTFDWDGNGVYDQTVTLDVETATTILLDQSGKQVYPVSGAVEGLTNGVTITGSETSATKATFGGAQLQWVAANTEIGRDSDGWWVGIKVNAPAGVDTATLQNAKYMIGGTEKSFWEMKDSADADQSHHIELWGLVTEEYLEQANATDGLSTYTWTFDWDADGVYDQTVTLEIESATTVLLDENGSQIYPELGQVSTYTGGTVVGSGSSNVTVTIEEVTLNWSAADPSIGRDQDAWWVGIKVAAPAGMDISVLESAKYQTKSGPNSAWVDKEFWINKDSADTDASHFIQLWFPITPASIAKFKSENRNITMWYQFDWDNNGTYEQMVTFSVVPSDKIVLSKVQQTGFAFATEAPKNQWVGADYQNVASGGQGDGAITYEIIAGNDIAAIDAATGVVEFLTIGTITVRATKAADSNGFYKAATATYTVTAEKNDQEGFGFETTGPVTITYAPGKTYQNVVSGVLGGTTTYSIVDEEINGNGVATIDSSTGMLTILKAGTVTIKATNSGDSLYNGSEATYTLIIEKADQTGFGFQNAPQELTWQAEKLNALTLVNGYGEGVVTWTIISGADVAKVDADGKITLLRQGTFTIQAQKAEDDCYNESTVVTATILVNPADQMGFAFEKADEEITVTYNDNGNIFVNEAQGGQSSADIVYTIHSGDAATVNSDGIVTILKAGTVVIQATKPADERYKKTEATYTLTILPDTFDVTFTDGTEVSKFYGINEYTNGVKPDGIPDGGVWKYTIESGSANIGASIDEATGKITFADSTLKVGKIIVKATREADECYEECSGQYTLEIKYPDVPETAYSLSGNQKNDSGWYTGTVTISAPEGYLISYHNELSTDDWAESVSYNVEGKSTPVIYLMDSNGAITDGITVEEIQLDTQAPINCGIEYKDPTWLEIIGAMFGFSKTSVQVVFTAEDVTSGIAKVEYNLDGSENYTALEPVDGVYSITVDAQYRGQVRLRVTDEAGWPTIYDDERTLVLDGVAPGITVGYNGTYTMANGILYTKDDRFSITFNVSDANYDLRANDPVIKVNGEEKELEWTEYEGYGVATLPLPEEGDYTITADFNDRLNDAVSYTAEVHVDKTTPVIDPFDFAPGTVINTVDGRDYYDIAQNVTIKIKEHSFRAEDVEVDVTVENNTETVMDYAAYAKDDGNWTHDGDVHTLVLQFDKDANYILNVMCVDILGTLAEDDVEAEFTVDTTDPENLSISYETVDWIDTILGLFGFSKETVKVTIDAEELTAGIAYLEYSTDSTSYTKISVEELGADGKYSFSIPAQFRNMITLRAVDWSGNEKMLREEKTLVVDDIAPGITATYNGEYVLENDIFYTKDDAFSITFTVSDANYDLRANDPVIKVNGEVQELEWVDYDGYGVATLPLPDEGDYVITADFNDRLNDAVTYTTVVHVDDTSPVINPFDFVPGTVINTVNGRDYYDIAQEVTITIMEHNFRAEDVEVVVVSKDNAEAVMDYTVYAKENANWTHDGAVHKLTLSFPVDANYTLTVNYSDLAGHVAETVAGSFTVDTKTPGNLSIEYESAEWIDTVLGLFGFSKETVKVTIDAEDLTAGIAYLEYSTDSTSYTKISVEELGADGKYSFSIPAQFRNMITLRAVDWSGNEEMLREEKTLVVDDIAPGITATYNGEYVLENDIFYTKDDAFSITFTVSDANYDLRANDPVIKVNGEVQELEWVEYDGYGVATLPLPAEGDYVITADFDDRLNNAETYTAEVHVDKTPPVIHEAVFTPGAVQDTVETRDFYKETQNVTFTIEEHNFNCKYVDIIVTAKNVVGDPVEIMDYVAFVQDDKNWTHEGNIHTITLVFDVEANYQVDLSCKDIPGSVGVTEETQENVYSLAFTVDKTAPHKLVIDYDKSVLETIFENIFFYEASPKVTMTASDATSGLKYFYVEVKNSGSEGASNINLPKDLILDIHGNVVKGDKGFIDTITAEQNGGTVSLSFKVPAQFNGELIFHAMDWSHNSADKIDDDTYVVVDDIAPNVQISYAGALADKIEVDGDTISRQPVDAADENTRYVYSGNITATLKITEANFYGEDVKITIERDGAVVTDWTATDWVQTAGMDEHTKVITLTTDGDYVITVEYADKSNNDMDWVSGEYTDKKGTVTYQSNILTIDTTKPVLEVVYDNNTFVNGKYYDEDRTATITITDRNFRPNEVVFTVSAKNVNGQDVAYSYSKLMAWADWKQDGISWTAKVPFDVDDNYLVDLTYTDIAGNKVEGDYTADFVVDKVKPQNLTVVYSDEVSVFEDILSGLTFGYYQPNATVTLVAEDLTAGIEYFSLDVKQEGSQGATNLKLPQDLVIAADGSVVSGDKGFIGDITAKKENGTVEITFAVPAQFRGEFLFSATDMAHNESAVYNDTSIIVVDNIAPDRTVTYEPTKIVTLNGMTDTEQIMEGDAVVMYYNKDAVAVFTITEANFYADDVVIKVNDEVVKPAEWKNIEGDTWTNSITLTEEGDYIITVEYPDRSGNEMVKYTSQRIVIDKTVPVIEVVYGNTNVKNTIDGRDYFDAVQTATITIKEHNFRADDVVVTVTAKDIVDANVLTVNPDGSVIAYAEKGMNRESWSAYVEGTWRREDDTYVLELTYSTDANYTFDIAYQDLATNAAADYEVDAFTVDKTAPENLTVNYSTSVLQQILESITFGFYNAEMAVTISATDDTSPIHSFVYGYINSEGVSDVNAEQLEQALGSAQISYSGNSATASFSIPKLVIGDDNQFNGTVRFDAYDRAGNSTRLSDDYRIVVDNISPTAQITYNAPVQEANGISYYAGDIMATIVINEANFYSSDVVVTVTKDGESYPVNVSWVDNSVDIHTGTFTLTEDGDYFVSVEYRDRSGNPMSDYISNELTLDTTLPVIEVSNIVMNSANKDEVYGFTITVNDINLDASSLIPVLNAVIRGEEGLYTTQQIDLGEAQLVTEGQTYTITVDNLPEDALYTLTCTVKDMSGNVMDQLVLEDGQSYSDVKFSINRAGSTFGFGNNFTEELVNQYYVYSVDEDVVIVEVNVDPIEDYTVMLNGVELEEGTDYTTQQTSNAGEWSIRTYTVSHELFAQEGEYSLIISSTDKANTTAFSDVKNLTVAFVVDQTAPVITISGLANDGRYQTEEQTVTLIPSDEGGRISSLKVVLMDSNGNVQSVRFELSGEELQAYLEEHDGVVTFTIPTGLDHMVQIYCDDYALKNGGVTNVYDETFTRVTVSQNQFVIFYANRPLFFGTIAGVLALIVLIIVLVKRKKDKKENKEKVNA